MPPPPTRPPARLDMGERVLAGFIAICCFAVLIIAWRLAPSTQGVGTHRQLGLPACQWMVSFGRPCVTCGMTTAFSHMAHGDVVASFKTQPFAAVLSIVVACGAWLATFAAFSAARIDRIVVSLLRPRVLWIIAGLVLAAWWYKIAVTPPVTLG